MSTRKFLMRYNGWLAFVMGTILFFVAPHIYHQFDPAAGQYDAGYIHPIIYALVVVSFASGASWTLVLLTAPGIFKKLDEFLEGRHDVITDQVRWAFMLYAFFVVMICATVWYAI